MIRLKAVFCLLFLIVLSTNESFCSSDSDSLKRQLTSQSDEDRFEALIQLAKQYRKDSVVLAYEYAQQALMLAMELGDKIYELRALNQLSYNLGWVRDHKSALYYDLRALRIQQEMENPDSIIDLAITLKFVADDYYRLKEKDSAEFYLEKSMELFEKSGNTDQILSVLFKQYAIILYLEKNYPKALEKSFQMLSTSKQLQEEILTGKSEGELYRAEFNEGRSLESIGWIYFKMNQYDEALDSYYKALEIFQELEKDFDQDTTSKGEYYLSRIHFSEISICNNIVEVYLSLKEYEKILPLLENNWEKNVKLNNHLSFMETAANYKRFYSDKKDYKNLHKYTELELIYKDSIEEKRQLEAIAQTEKRYRIAEKELLFDMEKKKLDELQKRRYLIYTSAIVFIILISILLLYRAKSKREKTELQNKNLQLQKRLLQEEVDTTNREIISKTVSIAQNKELLQEVKKKLTVTKYNLRNKSNQEALDNVISELSFCMNENIWKEFELSFNKVHSTFYKNLLKNHPDLTQNELKICALTLLNLSTKEIANITYKSLSAINNSKSRLRKKLQLLPEDNLHAFLNKH